jgi:hypothetical protein
VLEETLSDAPKLNVAVIGIHFATNESAVVVGFHVKILISGASREGSHGFHPEVIGVGTKGVEGLLEADFDFEAIAVEGKDLEWVNGDITSHKDHATAEGVVDENESYAASDGTPEEIYRAILDHDVFLSINGAGGAAEAVLVGP